MEQIGGSMVADTPDEVRIRAREQLMLGASQIKLTAGGGVASPHSPLDVSTFTEPELRAAVEAAENWGTFVCVHAYTSAAIQRSIAAGVRCIEHGHLMDEATAQLMAEKGIWLSTQPFLDDGGDSVAQLGPAEQAKKAQVVAGTERVYALAKKYKIKTAFGTDILFSAAEAHPAGRAARCARQVVHAGRGADDGDLDQCAAPRDDGPPQSLSGQARRRGGGGLCRPAPGRWRSTRPTSTWSPTRRTST